MSELDEIVIGHDEMEATRLKDLEGLPQEEAARLMDVSQPTFHRLIQTAHRKIADALVNGKSLRIEGGNIHFTEQSFPACGRLKGHCGREWDQKEHNSQRTSDPTAGKEVNMRIAITSTEGTMEGMVDERFGRCRKIVIYDQDTGKAEVVDNAQNMNSAQGAGIQTSQNVVNAGAKAVISGHLGPNAFRVLQAAGIEVYTASNMTVAAAIEALTQGKLAKLAGPDVTGHW